MIDFLGIGAQKAGTSWLTYNVRRHPEIWTPFAKELHYFDVKYLDTSKASRLKRIKRKVDSILASKNPGPKRVRYLQRITEDNFAFTEDWYRYIFSRARSDSIKGEFTPYYSCLPSEGIRYLQTLAPDVKMIYMIRDPVGRALSSLRMLIERGEQIPAPEIVSDPFFQLRGDYQHNITNWESVFDKSKILYIPFGRVRSDPGQVMQDVESFLGLSPFSEYPSLSKPRHVTAKIPVDNRTTDIIRDFAEPQYTFLQERFGNSFLDEIK